MLTKDVTKVVEKYNHKPGGLISILEEVQSKYGYLPEEVLVSVAEETSRSLVDVYGVATFDKGFSLKPRGKHLVSVCLGTACHVRTAPLIAEEFERELGIKAGETTQDLEFSFDTVNCVGACALGPVVIVDGKYHGQMNIAKAQTLLEKIQGKTELKES